MESSEIEVVETIKKIYQNRKEVHDFIGQLEALNEAEIKLFGEHREQRQKRAEAMMEAQQREADERVDICVQRKDIYMNMASKLNGVHPGPLILEAVAQNHIFLEERPRPRRKPFWRRWLW